MGLFGVMTNILLFPQSLFTSLGSGDRSSHHRRLCSLTGIFTTFLFLEEKHNTNLLPSSHTNPSSRGASTSCQIYPNHHNSPPPRLFPKLFQADFLVFRIHAQAEEQKERKSPA